MTLLCVDAKTHSDYRKLMSNMTSQFGKNRLGRVECLGWGLIYGALAALPLCGLVLFLEITKPVHFHSDVFVSTELASFSDDYTGAAASPLRKHAVARLKGVSAELGQTGSPPADAKLFSASEARTRFWRRPSRKPQGRLPNRDRHQGSSPARDPHYPARTDHGPGRA